MISVVINTLNETANIRACIESVGGLADELVVCDMHSDDDTAEIAEALGARVVFHERTGFVEPARKFAIDSASHEWVLVLDADERMTPALAEKLREVSQDKNINVVSFWSLYWYFGGWVKYGGFFNGNWRRFFRKAAYLETYRSSEEQVHMNFDALRDYPGTSYLPSEYFIRHLAYPSVEKYVFKTLGRYAVIEGEQYHTLGIRFSAVKMIWQPIREFIVRYVIRQGFRDGMRGFVLASLFSGYRFCVWANLWFAELDRKIPEPVEGTDVR